MFLYIPNWTTKSIARYLTFYAHSTHKFCVNMSHSEKKRLSEKLRKFLLFTTLCAFHGPIRILISRIQSNTLGQSKLIHERACKKNKEISWFFDRPIKNTLQSRKQKGCLSYPVAYIRHGYSATVDVWHAIFYAPLVTIYLEFVHEINTQSKTLKCQSNEFFTAQIVINAILEIILKVEHSRIL